MTQKNNLPQRGMVLSNARRHIIHYRSEFLEALHR
jgi:hypothetical protein